MKKQKIGTRLSLMTVTCVVVAAAIVFLTVFMMLYSIISLSTTNHVKDNIRIVEDHVSNFLTLGEKNAVMLSKTDQLKESVISGDSERIKSIVGSFHDEALMTTDKITILDKTGTVISRYYSEEKGDSMANQSYIQEALNGNTPVGVSQSETIPLGARATAPIFGEDGLTVIGAVTITYDLSDPSLLDEIKGDEDSEFTIFRDNVRLNTTVMNGTERAIGTEMDSHIAEAVLQNKEHYQGNTEIFGNPYMAAYSPIFDENNNVVGAIFAGINISEIYAELLEAIIICVVVTIIAAAAATVFVIIFVKSNVVKPVNNLVTVSGEMAHGNLSAQVGKLPNNEIGMLGQSISETLSNLQVYINDISEHMERMASGDMTKEVTRDYVGDFESIKSSINKISGALNNTLSSINIAAEQVNSGAEQVATAAQSLSQGATEQASSIQELSSSIMSVSEQVNENAKNVGIASDYVQESQNGIENSNQFMHQMMDAMQDINESSTQISKIIKVIDDIAFQTNILALNAAVEAARAGAAGKGFSVVADEVRNLASKSADAAKQTTLLIDGSVTSVGKGMEIAQETANALEAVKAQSEMVVETIKKIKEASNEQAESINQITIGLEQISSVVQTNSATSEESAAASQELSGQAQMLQEEISQFKLKNSYQAGNNEESFTAAPSRGSQQISISLDDDKY